MTDDLRAAAKLIRAAHSDAPFYIIGESMGAAVILVAALNVSDTTLTCPIPSRVEKGAEIGRFGMGSTVVALVADGDPALPVSAGGAVTRVGRRIGG